MMEDKFERAVEWLLDNYHACPQPRIGAVRRQFDMDFMTAVKVLAEAQRRRAGI